MPLLKLQFQPGINREGTEYSADAGWYNSDKVRFRKGKPEKIGGWEKYSINSFLGVCRSLEDWVVQDGVAYIGLGTTLKFYINEGNSFYDVTPIRATTTNGVTFAATDGSSTLTVTDDDHGASDNDFVTFSGAVSLGGLVTAAVLNQEYQIESITSTDVYTVIAKDTDDNTVTANSSDSGNGGSGGDGAYQISVGLDTYVQGVGWGANTWGEGTFGSASSLSASGQLRLYSQDVFGDDLLINVRAGGVYYWDESSGATVRAVALSAVSGASDAPTIALQTMMSDVDKHVICFGVNPLGSSAIDPLHVRWSDSESAVDWTPTAINSAGGVTLSTGSIIIGALKTRQEILIWTDAGIHSMRFIGSPFIFQFTVVNEGISMISPKAAVNAGGSIFFMDRGGFYIYTGTVQPITCSVLDYVFSNINIDQAYKVFASTNPDHNEVTWFYPIGSGDTDNTNYVTYNYAEQLWSIGTMERGAWIEANSKNFPLASSIITSSDNNYLYIQETGHDADGSAMTAFIESGDVEMGDGERYMLLSKLIPDFTFRGNTGDASMDVIVKGKDFPLEDSVTLSTSTITSSTKQAFLRARTRSSAFRIESSESGYGWRLGNLRFDMRPDGRR
tara:strand:- start:2329 stop:4179 length:1851 start_codon:yes stop_codon:yes gene_type:complete